MQQIKKHVILLNIEFSSWTERKNREFYATFAKDDMLGIYIKTHQHDVKKMLEIGKLLRKYMDEQLLQWIWEIIDATINIGTSYLISDDKFYIDEE